MKPDEKELRCIMHARRQRGRDRDMPLIVSLPDMAPRYEVSETKSFRQLWSDHGLRYMFLDGPKRECIKRWVQELYPFEVDTDQIEKELLERTVERRRWFYAEHPNGHINLMAPIDLLPEEIDRRFGSYSSPSQPCT